MSLSREGGKFSLGLTAMMDDLNIRKTGSISHHRAQEIGSAIKYLSIEMQGLKAGKFATVAETINS